MERGFKSWTMGNPNLRAFAVGFPPFYFMQHATGASRPLEQDYHSEWRLFKVHHGVSGHAFVGSIPFLVIAHQAENRPIIKYLAYTASFGTALSRINDDKHYFSQASFGWFMGWEAVDAVFDSQKDDDPNSFNASVIPFGGGAVFTISYSL